MDISIFLKGLIVGFSVAMPIGPIGILCIQRTLTQGRLYGFIFGLGVATADAIYGSIAAFGLTFISNFLIAKQSIIRLIGSIFLIYIGIKIILKNSSELSESTNIKRTNLFKDYTSGLFLTLTNPITIIIFAAIFSWSKTNIDLDEISNASSLLLVSGIFLGSLSWFTLLSCSVGFLRSKFKNYIKWINNISGIILISFGIFVLLTLILK